MSISFIILNSIAILSMLGIIIFRVSEWKGYKAGFKAGSDLIIAQNKALADAREKFLREALYGKSIRRPMEAPEINIDKNKNQ